eukprot:2362202-Rhodomonas_salina.1
MAAVVSPQLIVRCEVQTFFVDDQTPPSAPKSGPPSGKIPKHSLAAKAAANSEFATRVVVRVDCCSWCGVVWCGVMGRAGMSGRVHSQHQ